MQEPQTWSSLWTALASSSDPRLALLALCAGLVLIAAGFALGFTFARAAGGRAREAFAALAADALRDNTDGFLALAGERFARLEKSSESDWDSRHKALAETVSPLRQALENYRAEALELERTRARHAGELGEQLRALAGETTRIAGRCAAPPRAGAGES